MREREYRERRGEREERERRREGEERERRGEGGEPVQTREVEIHADTITTL